MRLRRRGLAEARGREGGVEVSGGGGRRRGRRRSFVFFFLCLGKRGGSGGRESGGKAPCLVALPLFSSLLPCDCDRCSRGQQRRLCVLPGEEVDVEIRSRRRSRRRRRRRGNGEERSRPTLLQRRRRRRRLAPPLPPPKELLAQLRGPPLDVSGRVEDQESLKARVKAPEKSFFLGGGRSRVRNRETSSLSPSSRLFSSLFSFQVHLPPQHIRDALQRNLFLASLGEDHGGLCRRSRRGAASCLLFRRRRRGCRG